MNLLQAIMSWFGKKNDGQVLAAQAPTPTATPSPTPGMSERDAMIKAIGEGFQNWGNPPAATLAATFADEALKYPDVYTGENRFMIPAISILESGGGKNLTKREDVAPEHRAYNITNWGINLPQGWYTPSSVENVIERTTSGIGSRTPAYQKFRESGNLNDFGEVYAPSSDNPGTGGSDYIKNLNAVMSVFDDKYKKYR